MCEMGNVDDLRDYLMDYCGTAGAGCGVAAMASVPGRDARPNHVRKLKGRFYGRLLASADNRLRNAARMTFVTKRMQNPGEVGFVIAVYDLSCS